MKEQERERKFGSREETECEGDEGMGKGVAWLRIKTKKK